jgi:hypothetical protein
VPGATRLAGCLFVLSVSLIAAFPVLLVLVTCLVVWALWGAIGSILGTIYYVVMKLDTPDTDLSLRDALSFGRYSVYTFAYNMCHRRKRKSPKYPFIIEVLRA